MALAGGLFVFAPAQAMAASAGCTAINSFSGTFTVDSSGNGTDKFTDPGTQVLANGETVNYSWSGNTKGAYVYVIYTQNGGTTVAPNTLPQSTAVSGSGSFTFTGTMSGDYLQMGLSNYPPYDSNPIPNPSANGSSVQITVSCSASTTLGVTMAHSGNGVQGGSLAYTITPTIAGGATSTATLTAAFTLPSGMTYVSASGSGWICSGSGQSGSCTRNTSFAAGSGPPITLNTSFASNASSPLAPSTQLSGGGASNTATASDSTTVIATPRITAISPTSGPSSGGTSVTITGTGLSGTTSVVFGGTAASGFAINSGTQVTATAPAGTGTVDVRVTTAGGTSATSAADQFTYVAAPTASAYTAPGVAYGATGVTFSLASQVTNSPTSFAVGSSTTANGGSVSINNAGLVTYSAPPGYRGNDSFTYTASNGGGTSSPATVTVPVGNPTLSSSLTGSGTRGIALSGVQITTTGGTGPYVCSTTLASGALPAGTQLNSNCTVAGTPAASGAFGFTANVTDSSMPAGFTQTTGTLTLVIAAPGVTLSPSAGALPNATAGTSYSQSFSAGSGTAPYTYAVTAGALPSGLTLSGSTLSGVPTQTGTFNFAVTATDSATAGSGGPYSVSKSYSITVVAPTVVVGPASLANGTAGVAYSQSITASGGVAPYTYAVTAGALPAGLTLASNGTLSGTPSAGGSFNFTIAATDSATGTGAPFTGNRAYSLTIAAPTITLAPTTLPAGRAGQAYSQTLIASGGTGPYTFAVTAGALPPGWTLSSSGVLAGTATESNVFNFTITATDQSTGAGAPYSGSRSYTATVSSPSFTLTAPTLAGAYGVAYTGNFVAGGGTAPYTYYSSAGTIPPGLTLAANGTLSGTPTAAGTFTFTVIARDSTTGPGSPFAVGSGYSFTVSPPAAPTAGAVNATVAYNASATSITLALSGASATSVAVASPPAHGTATVNGLTIDYTPTAGYYGADSFTYTATNAGGTSAPATVSITVATPAAPVAANRSGVTIAYDSAGTAIDLSSSITGTHSSVAVATAPAHGTTSVAGDVVTYTPAAGYYGADSFTYTATGPGGTSAPATVTLSVANPSAPTVAGRSGVAVPYGSGGTAVDLSSSITGVHSSIAVATAPAHGTTSVAGDVVTYTPAAGYYGADSFTYTATGPGGTSAPATVTLTVAAPAAPTVTGRSGVAVANGSTGTAIDLSSSISGVHSSIAVATAPAHGTTSVAGDVVTYTPAAGYYGADSFTYTATGPGGTSAPATVTLTVAAPAAPTVTGRSGVAVANGSTGTAIDLSSSITGVHSSIAVATAPAHGTTSVAGDVVTYTPAAGYYGADSFTYTATGPGGTSAPATVTLTVAAPPAPVAADRSGVAVPYGSAGTAIDLSSAITGAHGSIAVATAPAHGTTSVSGNVVTYTPATGYYGADSFTYTATGPGGTSAPATVGLVIATPAAPTVVDRSGVEVPNASAGTAIDLSSAIAGVHTSIAIGTAPSHGTATVAGNVVTYVPAAGYYGADSFTYTATGPGGTSAPATVSVTVAAPAPPTAANRGGVAVEYNSTGTPIDLTTSVSGVYSSIAVASAPAHGSTSVSGNVITYTPARDSFGADSFTYTATGPGGTSTPATVSLTVATPPPPAAEPASSTVPAATAVQPGSNAEINLSELVNGNFTSIEIQTPPSHGTLTLRTISASPTGGVRPLAVTAVTAVYTPNLNYVGADSFSFVAVGPGGRSAPAAVTIQVVGAAPQAMPKTAETGDGQRVSVDLTAGALNGPFTAAAVVGMTPADAAVTQVVASGSGASQAYRLDIVPAARFGGKIVIQYTLSNAVGTSAPATVTVTVAARPDPTLDPNVRAVSDAQAEAARRFGRAQVANFMRRTEQLHNGGGSSKPQMGVSLASRDQRQIARVDPAFDAYATTITERMRMSGEDPALGPIARRGGAPFSGGGVPNTLPAGAARPVKAGTPIGAGAANGAPVLAADDGDHGDGQRRKGSVAIWSGGAIDIGTQDATSDRSKITATTSGLSTGADIKLAEGVLLGIGGGYSNDVSRIGGSAARVRSESRLVAAYASVTPVDGAFIDGMVGFGDLSFTTRRQVGSTNAIALGSRDGNFTLGALALGIDRAGGPLRWSLYARGEFLKADLGGYVESGAGRMDLRFDSRDVHSLTGTLGARLEMEQRYGALTMLPRVRFEWNHELQNADAQRLDYADIPGQSLYSISTLGWTRNQYQLTLGTRMLLPRNWTLDFEGGYRGGGQEMAGTLRISVGKEF
ncbi:Ig-like domain-containing protein [Sphingomonas sp.]|uniref:Ig-like domain-containing protein n=1 Tax=Sphingomonas sp. TaxID=28214 RepID=UPI0028AFEACD|nr:Ig-like domain-containing protein [Sphingomonas sp.]